MTSSGLKPFAVMRLLLGAEVRAAELPVRKGCYLPREVFFFGRGLPVAAAFSSAAFFVFFAGMILLLS
jgi:hypothetical protein